LTKGINRKQQQAVTNKNKMPQRYNFWFFDRYWNCQRT